MPAHLAYVDIITEKHTHISWETAHALILADTAGTVPYVNGALMPLMDTRSVFRCRFGMPRMRNDRKHDGIIMCVCVLMVPESLTYV